MAKLSTQHASYSVEQLTAFRDGKRVNELMTAMVINLTDQNIKDLSVYYESLAYIKIGRRSK